MFFLCFQYFMFQNFTFNIFLCFQYFIQYKNFLCFQNNFFYTGETMISRPHTVISSIPREEYNIASFIVCLIPLLMETRYCSFFATYCIDNIIIILCGKSNPESLKGAT